jgi:hypothetical protein
LGTNTGGLHITLAISNSFFRENINVQNPKREARLNVHSCLFDKLQFIKI